MNVEERMFVEKKDTLAFTDYLNLCSLLANVGSYLVANFVISKTFSLVNALLKNLSSFLRADERIHTSFHAPKVKRKQEVVQP